MRAFPFLPLLSLLFLLSTVRVDATPGGGELFVVEFWVQTEEVFAPGAPVLSENEALQRVLNEAVFVFSGMIYGFRFTYTPGDLSRDIEEEYELSPVSQIAWGDPRLTVLDSRREDNRIVLRLCYEASAAQSAFRARWSSSAIPLCRGTGAASYFDGESNRVVAIRDGIRIALRERVRSRVWNRPREITGTAVLWTPPRIVVDSGEYRADIEIRLDVAELRESEYY